MEAIPGGFRPFFLSLSIDYCPSFVATFDGDSRTIRPGTESTVGIMFNPKFDGLFKATLELVFYDSRREARFIVRRSLRGIGGSIEDHQHFESLDQDDHRQPTTNLRYEAPQSVIPLLRPDRRHRSRKFPEYEVPPAVQEAVEKSNARRPYDKHAPGLVATLRPNKLDMDTYAQYFSALLNVQDGHLQYATYNLFSLVCSNVGIGGMLKTNPFTWLGSNITATGTGEFPILVSHTRFLFINICAALRSRIMTKIFYQR